MPSIVSTMSLCQISTIHQNKLHKSRLSVSPHLMSLSTKSLAAAFAEKTWRKPDVLANKISFVARVCSVGCFF